MSSSSTTYKGSNTPISGSVSHAADHAITKGDEYRNRGDFEKAKAKYKQACKLYPSEAHDRLEILPLYKISMKGSEPDRIMSVELRARIHNAKENIKRMLRHSSPIPSQQQSFFPRPSSLAQSTIASLVISESQSTLASQPLTTELVETSNKKIYDIINEFGPSGVTFDTVQELVVLADVRDREIFLHIVTKILHVLRDSSLLSGTTLQGLAVVLDSFPDDIDLSSALGAFMEILAPLQKRLSDIHTVDNDLQLVPLLSALNALLDAMVRRRVSGLDREAVYNNLRTLLDGLTSHPNVVVFFQALYAKQALAIIGNNETLPMSIFRRGKLAFMLAGNISNMAAKFDLASAESAYQNIKDIFDNSIRDGWYQGLIYADYLLGQRSWWQLEDFVLRSKFRSDICFQLGAVLRLEQIAVAQVDVRNEAIKFLTALGEKHIPLVPEMVQNALLRLQSLKRSTGGTKDDEATPKAYQGDLRPVWDPAWLAAPKGILFKAIQDRDARNATLNRLPTQVGAILQAIQSHDSKSSRRSIRSQTYYHRDLAILRVSGDTLPLETCFVNLAIVEAPAQREQDKQDLKKQAAVFHRIPSSEAVRQVNMQAPIPLEQLFDKRKLRDGKEDIPKAILVQGRAGVGKTTLCKKLVHAHQTGLWKDRFDAVLWLPLRQIKAFKARTLEGLFREKFFTRGLDQENAALAYALAVSTQQGRVLFVLDGLDEIAKDTRTEDSIALKDFIKILLLQQHVVIISRPSGVDRSLLPPSIDLELETIGFNEQNVDDFVCKVLSPKAAETVQRFIKETPLIRGLVNIPVQLAVICYSWDSLPTEGLEITMTGLYQLMVRKLWRKDALRLKKSAGGETLTQEHINKLDRQDIDELMAMEMQHLGYLAFKGLMNDHQIEFDEKDLLLAFGDLRRFGTKVHSGYYPSQVLEMMKDTSFLHTADADLDPDKRSSQQAWYFLHLTFQE
ncbi:hypothetical protein BGZ68_004879 [Mortierella alpina]|nr:hypothetical protein BGZ68_004879 [Mortierella alpina]